MTCPCLHTLSLCLPPSHSLDLLVDGLQLFLQHDGQLLHVRLSAGGQKLRAEAMLAVVLIVRAAQVQARLVASPHGRSVLPVRVLHTENH